MHRNKDSIIPNIEHCTPQENIMSNSELSKSMITDMIHIQPNYKYK